MVVKSVPERLRDAAELFEKRNAAYGGNYAIFGRVMAAMFPDGLGDGNLTEDEWGRLCHVVLLTVKLTRYVRSLRRGGHADSLDDMAVYAIMSAELDEQARVTSEESRTEKARVDFTSENAVPPTPGTGRVSEAVTRPWCIENTTTLFPPPSSLSDASHINISGYPPLNKSPR